MKRSERTIEHWLSRWNKRGYEGLIPQNTGGKVPKISSEEWDEIIKELEGKGMTIKDVVKYVKDTRGVELSYKRVWKVLRVDKKVK